MTRCQVLTALAYAATIAGALSLILRFVAAGIGELVGKL
jgi:hypothetical protein